MSGPFVILLDDPASPDGRRLVAAVRECGSVITIDPSTLRSLEVRTEGDQVEARLDEVPFRPRSVLVWRMPQVCDDPRRDELLANPVARSFHARQWTTMLRGLLMAWELDGVPIVNGADIGRWDEKTAQIILAASVGFRTPSTLQSARAAGIRSFLGAACAGSGVTKPFIPFRSYDRATSHVVRQLTREVSPSAIDERYERAVPTPALYQTRITAPTELRIALVGSQTFTAQIHRDQLEHIDARHCEAAFVPASAHRLAPDLEQRCRALLARCGLQMAVIDLLIGDDGEAMFLDLNPTGTFDWMACRFDLPIYPAVAGLLLQLARCTTDPRSTAP